MPVDTPSPSPDSLLDALSFRLAEDLVGIEQCAPAGLIREFPRIMARINELWPNKDCETYIDGLVIADRVGRMGFDPHIVAELFFLKELRDFLYPKPYDKNIKVEDLMHTRFQANSLQDLVERYAPAGGLSQAERLDPLYDSPYRPRGWGELSSASSIRDFLSKARTGRARLGDLLVLHGLVSEADLEIALDQQKAAGLKKERLGKMLVRAKVLDSMDLRKALCLQSNALLLDLDAIPLEFDALALINHQLALDLSVVPVLKERTTLVVAMENPVSARADRAVSALRNITGLNVRSAWAVGPAIDRKLQNYRSGRIDMI